MSKPCSHCESKEHTSFYCFKKPRKPIKSVSKASKQKKRTIKPKKKQESRKSLVKKLDAIYSQYIRLLKSDEYGYCICVTSGKRMYWTESQNGHFYSRKYYPTRWDDDNCHPQSMTDNVFLRGNYIEYTKFMIDTYGRDFVDELGRKAKSGKTITNVEIKDKINYYLTEVEKLKSQKSLTYP